MASILGVFCIILSTLFFVLGLFGLMIPADNDEQANKKVQALLVCFLGSSASGILAILFVLIEFKEALFLMLSN